MPKKIRSLAVNNIYTQHPVQPDNRSCSFITFQYYCLHKPKQLCIILSSNELEVYWRLLILSQPLPVWGISFGVFIKSLPHILSDFYSCKYSRFGLQRSRGLRRGSAAAHLVGLWIRIPPGAWMFVVSVMCSQVDVYVWGWSLVQKNPTECGVSSECDREAPLIEGRDMQSRRTGTGKK
jgi:hypothetical protein